MWLESKEIQVKDDEVLQNFVSSRRLKAPRQGGDWRYQVYTAAFSWGGEEARALASISAFLSLRKPRGAT